MAFGNVIKKNEHFEISDYDKYKELINCLKI